MEKKGEEDHSERKERKKKEERKKERKKERRKKKSREGSLEMLKREEGSVCFVKRLVDLFEEVEQKGTPSVGKESR